MSSTKPIVIVGIHGLNKKPAKETLSSWWKAALQEGLSRNRGYTDDFPFKMAHWANVFHKDVSDSENSEPWFTDTGTGPFDSGDTDESRVRRFLLSKIGKIADLKKRLAGTGEVLEKFMGIAVSDLRDYYNDQTKRTPIRQHLHSVLDDCEDHSVLLIAHSMGSIIANDVLRERESDDRDKISHLVTIGSPLGLPVVVDAVRREFGHVRVPNNVELWTNLADPNDRVSIDGKLSDDFDSNADGVMVVDRYIRNGYRSPKGKSNDHKSYGYLRTPEMSNLILNCIKDAS